MNRVRSALGGALLRRRAPTLPATSLHTGRAVPALTLRVALSVLSLTASAALGADPAQLSVGIVVGVAIAVRPHAVLLALGVAALIAMHALTAQHGWQLPVLVAVTHAVLQLGSIVGAVSWRGRIELAVLREVAPRFLIVQAVAQAAAGVALVLDGAPPLPWLVVAAVAALAALCWTLLGLIRRGTAGR